MKRKTVSGIVLHLLLTAVFVVSISQVKAGGMSGPSGPEGYWSDELQHSVYYMYRGGTFYYHFQIQEPQAQEDFTVTYWLGDLDSHLPPFEPLIVSWDPSPPVTLTPGVHDIYFTWTIPTDAPLGIHGTYVNVRGYPSGGGYSAWFYVDVSLLHADIDFDPASVIVGGSDWIYCYIEPPEPTTIRLGSTRTGWIYKEINYAPDDIDVSTLSLNNTVSAEPSIGEIGDFDGDEILDLKIAFNKSDVEKLILEKGLTGNIVNLNVTGQFSDGWVFAGTNQIEVVTPEQAITDLIDIVESMNLQQGIDNSLDAKLSNVLASLEAVNADQRNDAINKLYAFMNEVEAQRESKVADEQADYLIAEAQRIIAALVGE